MRRLLTVTVLILAAAATLTATAAAKEMSVSLSGGGGPPSSIDSGGSWDAELLVHGEPAMLAEATPGISIRNRDSGQSENFAAKATGKKAPDGQLIYRATVVFPTEGLWDYTLIDGVTDRAYEGGTVQVGTPAAAVPSQPVARPAEEAAPLPVWPFILGGAALLFAAAGAAFAIRHRRLRTA